ncbi:hypothetical protein EBB07_17425 [Paenibacillaceae bacterium]|nr:hypothetical protein EBB07_17425 [Paenibacillaceae bacterium]
MSGQRDVTFETKCYEKDWRILLQTPRLEQMIDHNNYPFKETRLYINNVNDPEEVSFYADLLVRRGILSSYEVVERHANEALDFFGIDKESFKGGYYYSIAELVSIYLNRTPYLLHYSGDSMLSAPCAWIEPALNVLDSDASIVTAGLVWNGQYHEAQSDAVAEKAEFYLDHGFSDQCYLIRTSDFRRRIYNEQHEASARYPVYGGELFEKRVDAWMRNHGYLRAIYKYGSYIHRNLS